MKQHENQPSIKVPSYAAMFYMFPGLKTPEQLLKEIDK